MAVSHHHSKADHRILKFRIGLLVCFYLLRDYWKTDSFPEVLNNSYFTVTIMLLSPSLNFLCQCFSDAVRIYLAFQLSHQLSYEKSHNLVLAAQKFSQRSRIGIYDLFSQFR